MRFGVLNTPSKVHQSAENQVFPFRTVVIQQLLFNFFPLQEYIPQLTRSVNVPITWNSNHYFLWLFLWFYQDDVTIRRGLVIKESNAAGPPTTGNGFSILHSVRIQSFSP